MKKFKVTVFGNPMLKNPVYDRVVYARTAQSARNKVRRSEDSRASIGDAIEVPE